MMCWMTVEEAAKVANCSPQVVYRLCEAGEIPACNLGTRRRRMWRIDDRMLRELMEKGGVR